jgi:hypothetical protein
MILILLNFIFLPAFSYSQIAFPGAEGFGEFTSGGRGGKVFLVTNLNNNGPGSLRHAIEAVGARTVIFRVSGTIILQSFLIIENNDITIAGQTAPGEGICIRDYPLIIDADNVILRFLRVRLGDKHKLAEDACSAFFRKNLMIDHCSFSWGIDEVLTVRDNENSTVQWCIISESLNHSYHPKGDHGYGGIWGGKKASFHHNLIAHNSSRNPRFSGSRYHGESEKEIVDFRNNVIYNWGFNSAYGGEGGNHNIIANYYKFGPASKHKDRIVEPWDDTATWYLQGNFVFGFPLITENNWAGGVQGDHATAGRRNERASFSPVVTQDALTAFEMVLEKAGSILPKRDTVDRRIVEETRTGIASFGGIWGKACGIIDSQTQVGGWPELKSASAPKDSDADGMPDSWEVEHGLNPENPNDRNDDQNQDGYTNLENYLNELVSGIEH